MNLLTLIKISWRNIWRNKLRSLVVIISIVFGLLGGIIIIAMSYGLNEERMNNAVDTYLSHIQIHNNLFSEDYNIKHTINNLDIIEKVIWRHLPKTVKQLAQPTTNILETMLY